MLYTRSPFPILVVTENLEVGGAEKYTVLVANELHARGHRVVVLANHGAFRKHFHPDIRFVRAFFESGPLGMLYGAFQIIRICWGEGIRLVHAQKLESSQAAWLARFVTGVPVVKTVHGYTKVELQTLTAQINRYADKLIPVIDSLESELEKNGVEKDKMHLIYNGINPVESSLSAEERKALRASLGIGESDPTVVSISRLVRGKNHDELIKWFSGVLARVPSAKLMIVGSGPERDRLMRLAEEQGIRSSVVFVEGTTDMQPYLHIADVFCTPSVARGMAVLEAMITGLPVVGTRPNGSPDVVIDGLTGFVAAKHDGEAFIERILQLLENPKLARRFGAAGKERAKKRYSHTTMVDEIEHVYAAAIPETYAVGAQSEPVLESPEFQGSVVS